MNAYEVMYIVKPVEDLSLIHIYCIIKWGIGLVAVNMPDGESYRFGRVE